MVTTLKSDPIVHNYVSKTQEIYKGNKHLSLFHIDNEEKLGLSTKKSESVAAKQLHTILIKDHQIDNLSQKSLIRLKVYTKQKMEAKESGFFNKIKKQLKRIINFGHSDEHYYKKIYKSLDEKIEKKDFEETYAKLNIMLSINEKFTAEYTQLMKNIENIDDLDERKIHTILNEIEKNKIHYTNLLDEEISNLMCDYYFAENSNLLDKKEIEKKIIFLEKFYDIGIEKHLINKDNPILEDMKKLINFLKEKKIFDVFISKTPFINQSANLNIKTNIPPDLNFNVDLINQIANDKTKTPADLLSHFGYQPSKEEVNEELARIPKRTFIPDGEHDKKQTIDQFVNELGFKPEVRNHQNKLLYDQLNNSAGVWQGYSVGLHTAMVLRIFNKFTSKDFAPNDYLTEGDFKKFLVLHDIGKGQAVKEEGMVETPLRKQKELFYCQQIIEEVGKKIGLNEEQVILFKALLKNVTIGQYLKKEITLKEAIHQLEKDKPDFISLKDFYNLAKCFHMTDAGAYKKLRYQKNLFSLDQNNETLTYDGKALTKINSLEKKLNKIIQRNEAHAFIKNDQKNILKALEDKTLPLNQRKNYNEKLQKKLDHLNPDEQLILSQSVEFLKINEQMSKELFNDSTSDQRRFELLSHPQLSFDIKNEFFIKSTWGWNQAIILHQKNDDSINQLELNFLIDWTKNNLSLEKNRHKIILTNLSRSLQKIINVSIHLNLEAEYGQDIFSIGTELNTHFLIHKDLNQIHILKSSLDKLNYSFNENDKIRTLSVGKKVSIETSSCLIQDREIRVKKTETNYVVECMLDPFYRELLENFIQDNDEITKSNLYLIPKSQKALMKPVRHMPPISQKNLSSHRITLKNGITIDIGSNKKMYGLYPLVKINVPNNVENVEEEIHKAFFELGIFNGMSKPSEVDEKMARHHKALKALFPETLFIPNQHNIRTFISNLEPNQQEEIHIVSSSMEKKILPNGNYSYTSPCFAEACKIAGGEGYGTGIGGSPQSTAFVLGKILEGNGISSQTERVRDESFVGIYSEVFERGSSDEVFFRQITKNQVDHNFNLNKWPYADDGIFIVCSQDLAEQVPLCWNKHVWGVNNPYFKRNRIKMLAEISRGHRRKNILKGITGVEITNDRLSNIHLINTQENKYKTLKANKNKSGEYAEVVFNSKVGINYIKKIIVKDENYKKEIIKELNKKNITEINNIPLEELFIVSNVI